MAKSYEEVMELAMELEEPDRTRLAQKLLECSDNDQDDLDPLVLEEAHRRFEELRLGVVAGVSHDEVMAAAREALRRCG